MGDARFDDPLRRLEESRDRSAAVRAMRNEDLVKALAAASRARDPLLANVLATETLNRYRRGVPAMTAGALGALLGFILALGLTLALALHPATQPDLLFPLLVGLSSAAGVVAGLLLYGPMRRLSLDRHA